MKVAILVLFCATFTAATEQTLEEFILSLSKSERCSAIKMLTKDGVIPSDLQVILAKHSITCGPAQGRVAPCVPYGRVFASWIRTANDPKICWILRGLLQPDGLLPEPLLEAVGGLTLPCADIFNPGPNYRSSKPCPRFRPIFSSWVERLTATDRCNVLKILYLENGESLPTEVSDFSSLCRGLPAAGSSPKPKPSESKTDLTDAEWGVVMSRVSKVQERQQHKKKSFKPRRIGKPGLKCTSDSECPELQLCVEKEEIIRKSLEVHNDTERFPEVKRALRLDGKECVDRFSDFLTKNSTRLLPHIYRAFQAVLNTLSKSGKQTGFENYLRRMENVTKFDFQRLVVEPVTRHGDTSLYGNPQGGYYGNQPGYGNQGFGGLGNLESLLPFFLITGGLGGSNDIGQTIILLSLLGQDVFGTGLGLGGSGGSGGGSGGFGGFLSNPFLIFALLGDGGLGGGGGGGLGGNSLLTYLLLSQSGGLGGDSGGYSFPLFLLLALDKDEDEEKDKDGKDDDLGSLLPLLFFSGGLGGDGGLGGGNCGGGLGGGGFLTFLLFTSILGGGKKDQDSHDFLLFFLLLGNGDCGGAYQTRMGAVGHSHGHGGGGSSGIELLLLLEVFKDMDGGSGNILNNTLPLLFLLGGLGTGKSGGPDSSLLLLLLSGKLNISDSLQLFFLADKRFSSNPLALLFFFGGFGGEGGGLLGSGKGGNSSGLFGGGGISNLLLLSLFFSNGDDGYTGGHHHHSDRYGGHQGQVYGGSQVVQHSPYGVSYSNPNLPPPGQPHHGSSYSTGGLYSSGTSHPGGHHRSGGGSGFGSLIGGGDGFFEFFILSQLLGGGGLGGGGGSGIFENMELVLFILLSQGGGGKGLFGSGGGGYGGGHGHSHGSYQQPAVYYPPQPVYQPIAQPAPAVIHQPVIHQPVQQSYVQPVQGYDPQYQFQVTV